MVEKNKQKKKNKSVAKSHKPSFMVWLKQNFTLILLLLAGISLPFITSSSILDQSLLPKFLLLCFCLGLTALALVFTKKNYFAFTVIDVVFGFYVFWQIISICWAFNFAEAVFSASTGLLFFLSYFFIKTIFTQRENWEKWLYPCFGFTAFTLASYGWFQFFTASDDGSNNMVYAVKGFAAHKNLFVIQLFLHLPFLIIAYIKTNSRSKYFYAVIALLVLLLLISLLARAFMVGFIVTLFTAITLWFFSRDRNKAVFNWTPVAIALPLILLLIIGIFSLRGGVDMLSRYNVFNFIESRNAQERFVLWSNTVNLIKEKPVLGLGAGNWAVFFPSTGIQNIGRMAKLNKTVSRPHNDYLWIASETGLIGLMLYLGLLVIIYLIAVKAIKNTNNSSEQKVLITMLSFLTGYLVIAFFDFPKERAELNFLVATIIAVISIYTQKETMLKTLLSFTGVQARLLSFGMLFLLGGLFFVGAMRYASEQKCALVKSYFNYEKRAKILEISSGIKHAFYNIDPAETPVEYYNCFAHFSAKDYVKAAVAGEKALLDSPYHVTSLKKIAAAYGELAQYEKAIPHFETLRQINPTDVLNNEALAISYYYNNQKEKARVIVEHLDSEHPSIIEMRRQLGFD